MDVIALRERGGAHIEPRSAGHGALAHLGVEERDLDPAHEFRQRLRQARPARRRAQHHQWPFGLEDQLGRPVERRALGDRRIDRMGRNRGHVRPRLMGDVLRQLEMNGARPLLLRHAERLPHHRRNGRRTDDLMGHLGQRRHGRDDVHDLKARLLAAQDSLLAGDHHHGHRAEQRIGRAGRQVESAGAERGEADPGPAGQPPMGRRHERRRLLMAGQHQFDRGAPQRLDDVEVLFPGNPEDLPHALVLERGDKQFGAVHRMRSSRRVPRTGGVSPPSRGARDAHPPFEARAFPRRHQPPSREPRPILRRPNSSIVAKPKPA